MRNVKIVVISRDGHISFSDMTKDKEYDAIILKPYENVPRAWAAYAHQKNDHKETILFIDDIGVDCACNLDDTLNVNFKIVE